MLRSSDAPTTVTERINSASTRLDELARAQGRGSQRLSNDAEHVLNLNPQSPNPLLVATGGNDQIDVGLGFQAGALEVRTRDGGGWANVKAQGAYFGGGLTADNIIAGNGIDCGGASIHGVHTGSARLDTAYVGGALTANNIIAGGGADFGGGFVHGVHTGSANLDSCYVGGALTAHNVIAGGGADFGSSFVHGVHTGSAQLDSCYVGGTLTASSVIAGGGADFGNGQVHAGGVTAGGGNFGGIIVNGSGIATVGRNIGTDPNAGMYSYYGQFGSVSSGAYLGPSDRRLKHSITDVPDDHANDLLAELRPREFEWHDQPELGRVLGFVAQEMPERFQRRLGNDFHGNPSDLTGYDMKEVLAAAVAALKTQQAQIDALTARVDRLERDTPSPIA